MERKDLKRMETTIEEAHSSLKQPDASRKVKRVYSNPKGDNPVKYYDDPTKAEGLKKTKLITKKSGQKIVKVKGEKRRKVESFYDLPE